MIISGLAIVERLKPQVVIGENKDLLLEAGR
jgi:hypothetical protein